MSINYTITEEDHTVTYTVEEGIGATGSDANVTNANVNLAISDNPQATRSALEIPINNFTASTAPTANDDETEGYSQGSKWYGGGEAYLCVDPTEGAAVWIKTTLTADELGDAAFKNTGSTTGTVAAGDDSRLSDARTPTAHASTHVTGGADKIRDASAAQDGLMTTAFASKLDGIAANANNYVHPNHSGDVTSAGDGATTIANNAVTFAKMQNISGTHLIGRHAGGSGNPQEVSVGNGVEFQGSGIRRSALTGDVTASAGSNSTTLQGSAVAARITEAAAKTTLVDADETALTDSAASFGLKKVTFANLFAYILTKIQAAASIVFTGQLRSSNQTAATGDAVMTRNLADARYMYEAYPRWRQIPLVFTGSSSGAGVTTTTTFGSSQINITANTTNQWGRLSRRIDASFFNTYVNAVNRARRYSITIEPGFGGGLSNNGDRSMAIGFNLSGTDPMDSSTLFPSDAPGFALVFIISTTSNRSAAKLVANQAGSQVESTPSGATAIIAVNEQNAYKIIFEESYLNSTHNRITVNMYSVSNITSNGYPTNGLRSDSYSASVDVARAGVAAAGGGYANLSFLCRDQSVNSGSCQLRPQEVLIFD